MRRAKRRSALVFGYLNAFSPALHRTVDAFELVSAEPYHDLSSFFVGHGRPPRYLVDRSPAAKAYLIRALHTDLFARAGHVMEWIW